MVYQTRNKCNSYMYMYVWNASFIYVIYNNKTCLNFPGYTAPVLSEHSDIRVALSMVCKYFTNRKN